MTHPVIGIIGGGQLGRMFIEEALRYNVQCIVLDADPNAPAALIAHKHIVGSITDADAIRKLSEECDIVTYEIEHIFSEALIELEKSGKDVIPAPRVLHIIQDKGKQKRFYQEHQIPTSEFEIVNSPERWNDTIRSKGWNKFVAKQCREGYDGRGVAIMNRDELNTVAIPFADDTVLEKFIENEKELSVIVAVDRNYNIVTFPVVEMVFDPDANLVTHLLSPADISKELMSKAETLAVQTIKAFQSPGLYAVEMFLTKEGALLVNEVAPRPHNSGHQTIEGNFTSQFEQLLRILLNAPLGSTKAIMPSAMINILGSETASGSYRLKNLDKLMAMPGLYIHMYGKRESRPNRKLGHITLLSEDIHLLRKKVKALLPLVDVEPVHD